MNKLICYGVICLVASVIFFSSNHFLHGYLGNKEQLGKELQSSRDSLYQYKITDKAPFKYRLLFPGIVKSSNAVVFGPSDNDGFYTTYKAWSLFFFTASACIFFYLLTLNSFSTKLSLFGSLIFLFLPPAFMAYTVPVHTREDPLAYCILFIGLIFLLKEYRWLFLATAVVGALCRETLLLLPMLYFFYGNDNGLLRRFFIAGLPCAVWLSLRLLMEKTPYDALEGFHWNNSNPDQVIGFLFLTYNLLWLPILHSFIRKPNVEGNRRFFIQSSILTLAIILITTYFGGIYNEIRLLYLTSPWVIVIALNFMETRGDEIKQQFKSLGYTVYSVFCLIGFSILMYFLLKYQTSIIKPGKYNIPYHLWIVVSIVYFLITMIFAPAFIKVLFNKNKLNGVV